MALINLTTNLKSLKFGNDQFDGGSSNQPYIQTPIPENTGEYGFLDSDFILRGGSKAVTDSLIDVKRLGKYFTDTKSVSGVLFIAKQNLLSRTAVRTQASGFLNEGVYTPLSTLIEAGGVAFGLHVNKQGLNPFNGEGSLRTYTDVINPELGEAFSIKSIDKNRLVELYKSNQDVSSNTFVSNQVNILTYGGGPDSIIGIGNTNIKFADQRTGASNAEYVAGTEKSFWTGTLNYYTDRTSSKRKFPPIGASKLFVLSSKTSIFPSEPPPASFTTNPTTGDTEIALDSSDPVLSWSNLESPASSPSYQLPINPSVYKPILPSPTDNSGVKTNFEPSELSNSNNTYTYSQKQLLEIPTSPPTNGSSYIGNGVTTKIGDFRTLLRSKPIQDKTKGVGNLTDAPNYTLQNIEQRVNIGNPGDKNGKNLNSYVNGSAANEAEETRGPVGAASKESYDKINALPIYKSDGIGGITQFDGEKNDLVKFAITVLDTNQNITTNIHFRAFLNQISDTYAAEWNPTKYIGRGENFYTYGGFDRKFSLSWTVAAQSKVELIPMYKKLNYLASVCAPNYSKSGYMAGNIVRLTVGGYLYNQPGIITGFSYEMNEDNATWEIGINDGLPSFGNDNTVKELPHLIKVTGFNFIPIHEFVPRLQQNGYDENGITSKYGNERFIALKAETSNYDLPKTTDSQ